MGNVRRRLRGALSLLGGLLRRSDRAARLDEEVRFHLEMATERHIRGGMTRAEAERAATRAFGGLDRHAEAARDEYRSLAVEELVRDVRHAARRLVRAPVFTAAAVITLGLGIAATTVVYSLVDHVVLRPLPYRDAARLVVVREVVSEIAHTYPTLGARAPHYLAWRERCGVCDDVGALRVTAVTWRHEGEPLRVDAVRVSANLLPLLGVVPARGRFFHEDEDAPGGGDVVVLSHAIWQSRFGGDPGIIGSTVLLEDLPREVIGVLPADFRLPQGDGLGPRVAMPPEPAFFLPLAFSQRYREAGGGFDYVAIARLSGDVDLSTAARHFDALQAPLGAAASPPFELGAVLLPLQQQVVGASGRPLLVLLAAVAAVLLLVCVNLANLLLARNAGRARESAVRAALGAGRGRLVREALSESVVLALLAGALALGLAHAGLAALLQLAPADMPRLHEVRLDARVVGVAVLVTALTALLFGVLPAWRSAGAAAADALKAGGRTHGGGRRATRARGVLIASQIALTTVLLAAAGLFLVSFQRVLGIDTGFLSDRVLAIDVVVPRAESGDEAGIALLYERVLGELRATPGVVSAAAASRIPMDGVLWTDAVGPEGDTRPAVERPVGNLHFVSSDYFATLGIPLLHGRAFAEADRGRDVVVLSAAIAAKGWPGENPVGRRAQVGGHITAEVIGVVADVATAGLEAERGPIAYLPTWTALAFPSAATLVLRTEGDAAAFAVAARSALRRASPGAAIARERTLDDMLYLASATRRFQLSLLVAFAVTGLLTACVGIYGVIAHSLGRRRGEIGVRLAFGARRGQIHRLVVGEAVRWAAAGLAAGIVLAVVAGRAVEALLYDVRPTEPSVLAAVAAILATVVILAAWIPARSASHAAVARVIREE